jgi:hypothetical protein
MQTLILTEKLSTIKKRLCRYMKENVLFYQLCNKQK